MTPWILPEISLPTSANAAKSSIDISKMSQNLTSTLRTLGVHSQVERTIVGPTCIRFELTATENTKMRDFTRLGRAQDLSYAMKTSSMTIQAPIPGEQLVGIEMASPNRTTISLGDVMSAADTPLIVPLGVDICGIPKAIDIAAAPHLTVAGRSGAGKSMLLRSMLCSILMTATPEDISMIVIDPKMTEMQAFHGIPHLFGDVIVEVDKAIDALWWAVEEMEARYRVLHRTGFRDLVSYNRTAPEGRLPYCLIVCDELADLMMRGRGQVESAVVRLGQKGRAAGIHLALATQSPRHEVLTGLIRANLPAKIALATSRALDSRIILDRNGAESLLGQGDMLVDRGDGTPLERLQAPFVPPELVEAIASHWRRQAPAEEAVAA